jgi:medium-chain acyl-[acyl-carrier-protein] hydrolase
MNSPTLHTRKYSLRYGDLDPRGEADPVALVGLLEDVSVSHCEESGWGIHRLLAEGLGWILLKGKLSIERYPEYGEEFAIETWTSELKRFSGLREYLVRSESGELLAAARSLWLFYSIERRRPVPVLDEIARCWAPEGTVRWATEIGEVDYPEPAAEERTACFEVRGSDLDMNGHLNNVRFLSLALEALPEGERNGSRLSFIEGHFKREVPAGSKVRAKLVRESPGAFTHAILAANGTGEYLAAAARSRWIPGSQSRG